MNIQTAQRATGLTARQIREYEKNGLIAKVARTGSNYRDYSEADIKRLRFIKRARAVDFSLAEIKALLTMQDNPCRSNSEVKALTARHIADLSEKIAQLQAMQVTLQAWHDSCKGDGSAECGILAQLAVDG